MAIWQLTEQIDNLYTTTWQHMKSTVADQVFDSTPFFFWLRDKGKLKTEQGGRHISYPLQYNKNDNVSWIGKGGTVQMNDFQFLTTTKWDWRYLVANIVRFGIDDQQNRGKAKIIDFMNAKLENTRNELVDTLEQRLFAGSGAQQTGFDGLQHLVADDPTTNVSVGEINQQDNTWWRNQTKDMTNFPFSTHGVSSMRTMLNDCSQNLHSDRPDIIVSGQSPYEFYEEEALDYYRTQNTKLADMGFTNQQFKGIPWVWSPACDNGRLYFINTNFVFLVYDPMLWFDMTKWKEIPDQVNDRAAQIMTALVMITNRRRVHGVMHNISL